MNIVNLRIENCCDCPKSYMEKIYMPYPFEYEEGLFCSKVIDTGSYNRKNKMIASDGWNVRRYADIPDWCPLLVPENKR